jgi:hypothetical protein
MRAGSVLAGLLWAGSASWLHAFTIPSATKLAVPASALNARRSRPRTMLPCSNVLWRCFGVLRMYAIQRTLTQIVCPLPLLFVLSSRCWLLSLSAFAFPGKACRCKMATQPRSHQHVVTLGAADQARWVFCFRLPMCQGVLVHTV